MARNRFDELSRFFEICEGMKFEKPLRYQADRRICAGGLLEQAGRLDEALTEYKSAMSWLEGVGLPYNFHFSCLLNKLAVPMVQPVARRSGCHFLQAETVGSEGRFGDTVTQYVALKYLESKTGMQALLPMWFGRRFFANANEPFVRELEDCDYGKEGDYIKVGKKTPIILKANARYLRGLSRASARI